MRRTECPSQVELTAFHLGNLSEAALEEVAEHVDRCAQCEAAARVLDKLTDPVIAAVRESAAHPSGPETLPDKLGDYAILGEIGRGGMGVVYRARDLRLGRVVALKMLLAGAFARPEERQRFRGEAEAIARLQHPNIVQIHEIAEHDSGSGGPRPYFTLEFVDGDSMADRLASGPQSVQQAATWLELLARAVQYAHEQGIIHRDLKPANVLLTHDGQPKLCDFGVAKLMAGSDLKTLSGMLIGTAEYMAPEQASGKLGAGPRTDVYALGAILYAMLTGRPPFQGATALQTLYQVQQQEPVAPTRLQPAVPRDLETICLKCLQKEPDKRYASAQALADDLHRFLAGEPILARPVGLVERAGKWACRRPAIAALLVALVFVTAAGFALVTWKWREAGARALSEAAAKRFAEEKGQKEQVARREAERRSADSFLDHGVSLCEQGEIGHGLLWMVRALDVAVRTDDADLERVARIDLAGWQSRLIRQRALLPHSRSWVWAVAFSPDGRTVATGGYDKTARLWDVATGQPCGTPLVHDHPVLRLAFSPDGRVLLTGSGERHHTAEARLWNVATGEPLGPPVRHPGKCVAALFGPKGNTFLLVSADKARLYNAQTLSPAGPPMQHQGLDSVLLLMAHPFLLASNAAAHQHHAEILAAALSPDGQSVVTTSRDATARVWNVGSGQALLAPLQHADRMFAVAFSPDGNSIATGCRDGNVQLWETATGRRLGGALRQQPGPILTVAFSARGDLLATGGMIEESDPRTGVLYKAGGEACVWDLRSGRLHVPPLRHPNSIWSVAFHPTGQLLLTGCEDGTARFFLTNTGALVDRLMQADGTVTAVAFSPDGRWAATSNAGGGPHPAAHVWEIVSSLGFSATLPADMFISTLAFRTDGRALRIGGRDGIEQWWDLTTGRRLASPGQSEWPVSAISAPNDAVLSRTIDNRIRLADRATGQALWEWRSPFHLSSAVGSPDGRTVAASGQDRFVRLWDVASGEAKGPPLPHQSEGVYALQFSPDSRTVLSGGVDRTARLWDVATCKPLGPALVHPQTVRAVAFCPDGRQLATGCEDERARIADVPLPVGGSVERVRLWVETLTGMELYAAGAVRELDADTLQQRREQLERLGGPPVAPAPTTPPHLP